MVYTEDQIEKMTDFEINRNVAVKLFGRGGVKVVEHSGDREVMVVWPEMKHVGHVEFWPTSSWNYAMTIAEKYGISLNFRVGQGLFPLAKFDDSRLSINKNPRRAICETFLMMDIG